MSKVVVALILNRNRLLISKIPSGELKGKWQFPAGTIEAGETEFEAVNIAIKEQLGVDIFPYKTITTLSYDLPTGTTPLTLIKCSISNEAKTTLSTDIWRKHNWIYVFNNPDIAFGDPLLKLAVSD